MSITSRSIKFVGVIATGTLTIVGTIVSAFYATIVIQTFSYLVVALFLIAILSSNILAKTVRAAL